jgi:phosphopantothenoylcysteine synthetase/decarboxylase
VADYAPSRSVKAKLKKSDQCLTIKLKPTPDILMWAGKNRQVRSKKRALSKAEGGKGKRRILVGFALEDKAVRCRAEKKLIDKKLDMIVANSPAAIGADKSDLQIKAVDSSWVKIENATKAAAAKKIIRLAEGLYR